MNAVLASWRPGETRDAVLAFLEAAREVPVSERIACFDNDGTLWCERPTYVQFDFFLDALHTAAVGDPTLAEKPEFNALLHGDQEAIGRMGLERSTLALAGLFEGVTPSEFTAEVRRFMTRAHHDGLGRPVNSIVYAPMLELLDELRKLDFTVSICTGAGTEFVRAVSQGLYGVPPELVAGTPIAYEFTRRSDDVPRLLRTTCLQGDANEGAAKVGSIQTQLGRRPILAGGNSAGDREMLEWAAGGDGPGLALLIDHDDAQREYAYVSRAATFNEDRPITEVGAELGWTVVSMERDWGTIFPQPAD